MPTASQISTLWIVVLFNMVFADVLSFMYPGFLAEVVATGTAEGVAITPVLLVVAAAFIELAIVMIYLSKALPPALARRANLLAVGVTILFVVGGGSLKLHYLFFASIEVLTLLYIGALAWRWRND